MNITKIQGGREFWNLMVHDDFEGFRYLGPPVFEGQHCHLQGPEPRHLQVGRDTESGLIRWSAKNFRSRAVSLTTHDLFFPYAHLIIYQTILLHAIAKAHQRFGHSLKERFLKDVLWWTGWLTCIEHLLRVVLLTLKDGKPTNVKLAPKFKAFLPKWSII